MTREEAKELFRNDKDAYGKPRGVMGKIDQIYDSFADSKDVETMICLLQKMDEDKRLNIQEIIKIRVIAQKLSDLGYNVPTEQYYNKELEFSIGPNNDSDHRKIMHWLTMENYSIKGISFEGDHYSEIHCIGNYNKAFNFVTTIPGTSIEHWED